MTRIVVTLTALLLALATHAQLAGRFTHNKPLIVVADSGNEPYEFMDEQGRPRGYHVDLISHILDQMLIPYRFVFLSPHECRQAIEHQEADLMLDILAPDEQPPYAVSRSVLSYLHQRDKHSSVLLEEHITGSDRTLVEVMDNQLFRITQSGEAETLHDKWFAPERVFDDASPLAVFFTIAVLIAAVLLMTAIQFTLRHARNTATMARDLNKIMSQALSMADYNVTEYDIEKGTVRSLHGNMLAGTQGVPLETYLKKLKIDPREEAEQKMMVELAHGSKKIQRLHSRWNAGTEEKPDWHDMLGHALTETDEDGRPIHIISSLVDISSLLKEQKENAALSNKYEQTFNGALAGLALLSPEGYLLEANIEMRRICHMNHPGAQDLLKSSFFDLETFHNDYPAGSRRLMHNGCHLVYAPSQLDCYVEMRIRPIFNNKGDITNYTLAMRDVTGERQLYLDMQQKTIELEKAAHVVNDYDQKLSFLLENSDMYVWGSHFEKRQMSISRTLLANDSVLSFDDYLDCVADEEREQTRQFLDHLDQHQHNVTTVRHLRKTHTGQTDRWMHMVAMPHVDGDGHFIGHFGLMRDITSQKRGQERLKQETARAENSGQQKSAFLANMTHEIRTPLNAIVGFSDLLGTLDSPEERREFTAIIQQNCDVLIRLIDDILEASNMDTAGRDIIPQDVDFSSDFHAICQTLSARVTEPGVEFQEDNPLTELKARQDMGRVRQILTNFVTNAVKYTKQGHIRVGYRLQDEGLYIYCEDTGAGIPLEKQGVVFDRFVKLNDFVQGTGLGLAICRAIVENCHGRIGVTSEGEGKGSTFWVWLPLVVEVDQPIHSIPPSAS